MISKFPTRNELMHSVSHMSTRNYAEMVYKAIDFGVERLNTPQNPISGECRADSTTGSRVCRLSNNSYYCFLIFMCKMTDPVDSVLGAARTGIEIRK